MTQLILCMYLLFVSKYIFAIVQICSSISMLSIYIYSVHLIKFFNTVSEKHRQAVKDTENSSFSSNNLLIERTYICLFKVYIWHWQLRHSIIEFGLTNLLKNVSFVLFFWVHFSLPCSSSYRSGDSAWKSWQYKIEK